MQKVIQMTEEEYNSLLTNAPSGVLEMTNSKLKNKLDVALSTLKELEDKLLQYELVKTNIVHKESKAKELTEEELNDLIKIIIYTSESIISSSKVDIKNTIPRVIEKLKRFDIDIDETSLKRELRLMESNYYQRDSNRKFVRK